MTRTAAQRFCECELLRKRSKLLTSTAVMLCGLFAVFGGLASSRPQAKEEPSHFHPQIPAVWDDKEMEELELPLASHAKVRQMPAAYYNSLQVRTIYKTYPIYHPDSEPAGYFASLLKKDPESVFNPVKLRSKQDWIDAGKQVFESAVDPTPVDRPFTDVRNRAWYAETEMPLAKGGVLPFYRYVIRERGKVEVTMDSCATCHTRVLPDGTMVPGAQGNIAFGRLFAYQLNHIPPSPVKPLLMNLYGMPWVKREKEDALMNMGLSDVAAALNAIPHGVNPRQGTSISFPLQVPDLIGVADRKYLDHTGLQRNRSMADLMRYDAINSFINELTTYNDFRPVDALNPPKQKGALPDPKTQQRYSDEQLYALALYVESLAPPPNPNKASELTASGEKVFVREGCENCHTPPLYTNNKLAPVEGYDWRLANADLKADIVTISVGTDPSDALLTRRGTGFYKIPSLKGVWYRGPFEHNGSAQTLEEWFNPARVRRDYKPAQAPAYGKKFGTIAGHPFGLSLSAADKTALIAFLRTL